MRACSCCFLVGSSARSECGIVHVISRSSIERARALSARTVDGDEGVEVLYGQQRVGQLPDEELQQGGGVVLLELAPREHAVIEGRLQLLTQRLVGRVGGGGRCSLSAASLHCTAVSLLKQTSGQMPR